MWRSLALLVLLAAASPRASAAPTAPQAYGEFVAFCSYSHRGPHDPIVHPGMAGMSHMHEFLGNTSTGPASTVDSLLAASTTCDPVSDLSAYWVPTLYDNADQPVPFERVTIYYIVDTDDANQLELYPPGLKIIAGDATASAPPDPARFKWSCLGEAISSTTDFVQCPPGSRLEMLLNFPDCWNGVDLDSPNHKSHMAYRTGSACPPTHPVPVPRLQFKLRYASPGTANMRLASGPAYTMHGDFFNAWQPAALASRMQCLRDYITCGAAGHPNAALTPRVYLPLVRRS